MTAGYAAEAVAARLERAGFVREPGRFKVALVTFDFPAVLTGGPQRGTDLVVVIDTAEDDSIGRRGARARQRLEALTLALDVESWRVVVTAVLAGPPLPVETIEEIARTCRVLTVDPGSAAGLPGAPSLDDRLRVLLPLQIGEGDEFATDPIGQMSRALATGRDARIAEALIAASARGEDEVRRVLAREVTRVVSPGLAT
jgi:hypothetical protein